MTNRKSLIGPDITEKSAFPYRPVMLSILLAVLIVIPFVVKSVQLMNVLILIMLGGYQAMCWNLMSGLTGVFSMGHVVFFGIGAYTSSVLFVNLGLSPLIGMIVGGFIAALAGIIMGAASLRLESHYFGLATLAFSQIMLILFNDTEQLFGLELGGAYGLMIPAKVSPLYLQFRGKTGYYFYILALTVLIVIVTVLLMRSRLGYFGKSIRDDQAAAEAAGIRTTFTKIIIAAISAFLTALGGTFYAQFLFYIDPSQVFNFGISTNMICYSIMGGIGTVWGPLLGAAVLVPLEELVRTTLGTEWAGLHVIIYGVLTIVVLILVPGGLVGLIRKLSGAVRKRVRSVQVREGRHKN